MPLATSSVSLRYRFLTNGTLNQVMSRKPILKNFASQFGNAEVTCKVV